MRLPRMTTRRWMVVLVVVGLIMGGVVGGIRLKRRHDGFRGRIRLHVQAEIDFRKQEQTSLAIVRIQENLATQWERAQPDDSNTLDLMRKAIASLRKVVESFCRSADYHAAMVRKYRRAARYPWLPVEPDPPAQE